MNRWKNTSQVTWNEIIRVGFIAIYSTAFTTFARERLTNFFVQNNSFSGENEWRFSVRRRVHQHEYDSLDVSTPHPPIFIPRIVIIYRFVSTRNALHTSPVILRAPVQSVRGKQNDCSRQLSAADRGISVVAQQPPGSAGPGVSVRGSHSLALHVVIADVLATRHCLIFKHTFNSRRST